MERASAGIEQLLLPGPEVPRSLVELNPLHLPRRETPVLIVGGGVAGLSAALAASRTADTLVLLKGDRKATNTAWAQGGMAAVLNDDDSIDLHARDTTNLGYGLAHAAVVDSVVADGPGIVESWLEWGGNFDRDTRGALELAMEGGHTKHRIIHSGDHTGAEIQRMLIARAASVPRITVLDGTFVLDLITEGDAVRGAIAWSPGQGYFTVWAGSTILCTGGGGQLFRETSNPPGASADGVALAYRAGARVRGLEFVQFHPTTLYVAGMARFLVSETARGEGGILRDRTGHRFMPDYHESAELAPRDVVSRAIVGQMGKVRDSSVYLDMTHLPSDKTKERFPVIYKACLEFGIDMTKDLIPVHPACHYMVGGVTTDDQGVTTRESLYACGETASSGFHGANRMGSNSLLEGAVIGDRAGRAAAESGREIVVAVEDGEPAERYMAGPLDVADLDAAQRSVMWRLVGIERDAPGLAAARSKLETWNNLVSRRVFGDVAGWELTNKSLVSRIITEAANTRFESRGTHFRRDQPETDDSHWLKDINFVRPDLA